MRYIISDIHGCYDEYKKLLEKINFSDEDILYVLGDAVDRGPKPIEVLKDMMSRSNVVYILGNHDFMMLKVLGEVMDKVESAKPNNEPDYEFVSLYNLWLIDGGETTQNGFLDLCMEERREILEYIRDSLVYETIEFDNKEYILVHAGISDFDEDTKLEEYGLHELITERMDYSKRYYSDKNKFIVTGHTPTICIEGWNKSEVYIKNGHIAIDCGCVYGYKLAAYCIETGEVTYVQSNITD